MPTATAAAEPPPRPAHTLPAPFSTPPLAAPAAPLSGAPPPPSSPDDDDGGRLALLTQGAEALVYRGSFLTPATPCALKYRPPKPYRHPLLDRRLARARVLAEARALVKARREGVGVPGVLGVDWEAGWLALEWIPGVTVRRCLDRFLHTLPAPAAAPSAAGGGAAAETPEEARAGVARRSPALWQLMARVGRAVGRMHAVGVVHGDLTTSNLMLRPPADGDDGDDAGAASEDPERALAGAVVLIDFGLAAQSAQDEDRAVDLYVLERAFGATHPAAGPLFGEVLRAYGESYRGARAVLRRLEEVRMRGRKRSMVG